MDRLGTKIQKRRKELNLTQEDLANKIGYKSISTIAKIEKNINNIPLNKIYDFCEALNLPIYELLPENENIEKIKYESYLHKIIELKIISLNVDEKKEIVLKLNKIYKDNQDFYEGLSDFNFNINKKNLNLDKYISDVELLKSAYSYNVLPLGFFLKKLSELTYLSLLNINLSINDEILDLQKELVDLTTKINDYEEVREIYEIVKLKYNRSRDK